MKPARRTAVECDAQRVQPVDAAQRYADLFDRLSDAVLLIDFDSHTIVDANQQALRLYGYTRDELIGMPLLNLVDGDDHAAAERNAKDMANQPGSTRVVRRTHRRKDNTPLQVAVSASLIECGGRMLFQDVIRDETKRIQLERELARTTKELRAKNQQLIQLNNALAESNHDLDHFASVLAHDLHEPLRAVRGFSEILQRSCAEKSESNVQEAIGHIVEGVARMQRLITAVRKYSRATVRPPDKQTVDCNAVVDESIDNLRDLIQESGGQVTRASLPTVRYDPDQMLQLFQNLIQNAVKFRRDEPPVVRITANRNGHETVFRVEDNGVGIDASQRERVFDIFFRVHTGCDDGAVNGLGLAICKRIVQRHQGRIWVESTRGKGSAFYFSVPSTVS